MSGRDPELLTLTLSLPGILGALDWMALSLFWKVREEHAISIKHLLHARQEPRQCYPFSLLAMTREGLLAPFYRSNMEALQPRKSSWLKVRHVQLSHCWDLFFFLFQNFKNISKYFSKEEWARLEYSEKISYVYMKRNYETMTRLGNRMFWVQTRLGINDDSSLQAMDYSSQAMPSVPHLFFSVGINPRAVFKPSALLNPVQGCGLRVTTEMLRPEFHAFLSHWPWFIFPLPS